MSKERKAQLITLGVLATVFGLVVARRVVGPASAPPYRFTQTRSLSTPQETIYQMFDFAREGNVRAYLALHTGEMEALLRAAIQEQGEANFAKYLQQTSGPVKGIALQQPELVHERLSRLRVEYVYQDRNEAQTVYLEKLGEMWKISRVDTAQRIPTLVPYGTPVP
ncbi:MAG: hypothetical protein NZV14_01010 [Bryobacteraceae bacterium]|nr:hypothetical protein [Bryobacteraceae bacterium]MDW8376709.1 hypothetical protein [Bryobacterales bacterium]